MASKFQLPEITCLEPDNYRKYFRALCWVANRKLDKKCHKKIGKKDRLKRPKPGGAVAVCSVPALLRNPSHFTVYATVRKLLLSRWRLLRAACSEGSEDSDNEEASCSHHQPPPKVPKITGIGLRMVFSLVSQARFSDAQFCEHSLKALLDVLQGHTPEEMAHEPNEIISTLHAMLVEIAGGSGPTGRLEIPTNLTALSTSCLIALSVARGEAELILNAVASLIMTTPSLAEQYIQVPTNLTTLQRSVQTVILDVSARNQWMNYGVPHQALVSSFPVDLPSLMTSGPGELIVRSLASDGCFLYIYTSKGLLKIGSGYGSSIRQHIYLYKPDFFASDRHGWLGHCKNKLYVRIGRKKPEVFEVNKETLEVNNVIKLDPGNSGSTESKSAVFTDGNQLGLILLTTYDNLLVKMYDVSSLPERGETSPITLTSRKDLNVHLLRRRTLALGRAPFEDGMSRRSTELERPIAMQFDDNDEDPLVGICAGQDFGLLTTATGKVYYTGKGTSLGYKVASPHTGRWTLMKETLFNRNEPNVKKCKVIQVAVGHEGVHAIFVLDNGNALFTGIARRGEDGDSGKHRRTPKPTRPKKITKVDGHYVVYAACNYGSTALVTRQGLLFMFGKDTQHCDDAGVVTALRHERVVQVALGKAHAIVLSNFGHVYTFGINNKSQCGREFGYTKEKMYPRRSNKEEVRICEGAHSWLTDYCRVCTLCRQCTGFAANCDCASMPIRVPGDRCGCGEGESGCNVCGICRRCAESSTSSQQDKSGVTYDDVDVAQSEPKNEKETAKEFVYETQSAGPSTADPERDAGVKVSSLPPARVAVPGGHRVTAIACGLHHSVLLTEHGEVLTFGSNQLGQLGAGDIAAHHRIVRVRVPRASAIAAGSNHTAVLTRDGELLTFGCYQKGSLGRPRIEDQNRPERSAMWYALPGRVPRLGSRHACKAVWVSASGDQTFVQVSQSVIKTDTLFSSTITANSNSIVILPNRPEHTFKCITINRLDGTCNAWTGSEQVDFVNTLATLDPLYDVLWCYQPQMRVIKCYNILAFNPNKLLRCFNDSDYAPESEFEYPNYGLMRRLEDFKDLETFEKSRNDEEKTPENLALTNMSVLNQDLAIPNVAECFVTRMHAALHLMGCLDSLTYAHDNKLTITEYKAETTVTPVVPVMEDFLTVNRFGSHGGGWGYSGQSIEAIRFMCDTDIILGGYGLFGGRGDYTAKIKLYDVGMDGGDQEGDGEILAESEEIVYECAPRDRFPVLFDTPITLTANRWYVAWACINGPSSDCGSAGQAMVINDDVGFHFKTSKKSNNGTDVNAGQIPCLLYNVLSPEQSMPIRHVEKYEPVIVLSRNVSRKVTVACFKSLIILMQWSWKTFRDMVFETNGLVPINYEKLSMMKHQKRLVYVIKACLRLVKSYINEIYPQNNKRRNSHEYMSYFESIGDVRNFIQLIMSEHTPTCEMLPRRPGKARVHRVCLVQFALELTNSILKEAHDTVTSCFHAFFPTPTLKWNHLCSLLFHVKDGKVPPAQVRELTATCAAMCASRSLQDVLQYIVPVTHSCLRADEARRTEKSEIKVIKDAPSKSATVPRSSHLQKPPPVPPRMNNLQKLQASTDAKSSHMDWHLMDVVPRLLDIVVIPIKQKMATRQCSKSHDHGEIGQQERLSEFCSKLVTRIIAELSYSTVEAKEELDTNAVKHLITPSRFIRVNQNRAWNTGNGSPDAISFTVDRPGIMLVGACVYGGLGNYEFTLELMHDVRTTIEEPKPTHCWISVDVTHGTFSGIDCQHDMATIKFERPILLKEEYRYAIRLCNHGGRTVNGDCGLPSVKGPDGTTFNFASCSLSFNGTTLARGQIPCLIYYGTSTMLSNAVESTDAILTTLRTMTMRVTSMTIDRSAELFCSLRNELSAEELRRNVPVLQHSPVVNTLLPYTLANLEALDDTKSSVQLLEMIHKILPHVAAMNLLVPSTDDLSSSPTHYYTWVESDHPYQPATVTNMRVLFPSSVSWVVLEMDPRSITAQPEDTLTIYAAAGVPKHKCQCVHEAPISESPFRKVYKRLIQMSVEEGEPEDLGDDGEVESNCIHHNRSYISVTPRLANVSSAYPQKALLIPGNEVIFSLETASDYLSDYNKTDNSGMENRYGFRCLCVGYEDTPFTIQRQGLLLLEMELTYAGAACASRLLAPDLELPPMSFTTLADIQFLSVWGGTREGEPPVDNTELTFISRGLELSSPPTIHQVLDGQTLTRGMSTEHQFLADFVAGTENTAGGRLAHWLAPMSRVEPSLCELKAPTKTIRPSIPFTILIYIRDQYGDPVISPSLKVEMIVQRVDDNDCQGRTTAGENHQAEPDVPYQTTVRDAMCYHAITMMKEYQNYSFEELRLASGIWFNVNAAGENASEDSAPTERVSITAHLDGTYLASWMPRTPGQYVFTCMLDDRPAAQEITLEVLEPCEGESDDKAVQTGNSCLNADGNEVESLLLRFAINYSAGLRVRASPSLQAEEIGQIPPGASVAFVEEVVNVDGAWVRLNEESMHAYTFASVGIAWCLQHNRHLDMLYLVPVETSDFDEDEIPEAWSVDPQAEANSWNPDEDEAGNSDFEERKFPFSIDLGCSDSDEASSPFDAEPSKRSRQTRKEAASAPSPKRFQRKYNGNDWWAAKQRLNETEQNAKVKETAIGVHTEPRSNRRFAQASTQTSPDTYEEDALAHMFLASANAEEQKEGKVSPNNGSGEGSVTSRRRGSPPPLPARVSASSSNAVPSTSNIMPSASNVAPSVLSATASTSSAALFTSGAAPSTSDAASSTSNAPSTSCAQSAVQPGPSTMRAMPPAVQSASSTVQAVTSSAQATTSTAQTAPPIVKAMPFMPRKYALSPTQAECLRTIFAALLWHEGIVHDAIACAAFLKFHPQLPKQGARVLTRGAANDPLAPRPQRHSVEVAAAGQYLSLNPSTLESLTRSGAEARASRDHKADIDEAIKEEDAAGGDAGTSHSVVNVLPPALRALVALWDALYDADQLAVATDKFKKEAAEKQDRDDSRSYSGIRKRKDWRPSSLSKAPYSVRCELCGGASVPPPLGAHMRHAHAGCRAPSTSGYDRAGVYRCADATANAAVPAVCGQLAQAYHLWYMFCEKCREKTLRSASALKQTKSKVVTEVNNRSEPEIDHRIIKDNALFLLDVAPITNQEAQNVSSWYEESGRSPPTPPGSMWQPAPPFQCLPAFGAAPRTAAADSARYHSLGRPSPPPPSPLLSDYGRRKPGVGAQRPRVQRSVSMGQAGRDLLGAARPPLERSAEPDRRDTYSASAGSSLLAQPSAGLRRLISSGDDKEGTVSAFETPRVDPATLFRSPVLTFILSRRDLQAHRQKMDAAARINTVRQYACEALNWLLRSSTQPTCVHDAMWWFCEALSQFSSTPPPACVVEIENQEQQLQAAQQWANDGVPQRETPVSASTSALCPGGRSVRGARSAMHAFLGSVSALAPSLHPSSAPGLQAVRCWALQYSQHDRTFLHRSQVFSVISRILSHGEDGSYDEGLFGALHESYHTYHNKENFVWTCPEITGWCDVTVSSRHGMAGALTDGSTETFWESGDEDRNKAKWIQVICPSCPVEDRPYLVCLHVDNTRDTVSKTLLASFLFSSGSNEMAYMYDTEIDVMNATWVCYSLPRIPCAATRVRCELRGPEAAVRVRQVRVFSVPRVQVANPAPSHALQTLVEHDTLRVFRLLTSQVFGKLLEWEHIGMEANESAAAADGAITDDSDLREHVVGILFAGHKLTTLQRQVMTHIVCAIRCEATRVRDDWETVLLCSDAVELAAPQRIVVSQDNYCFEMLSLLLALSGSAVGRVHLAQRSELLCDLLSLLHTGSDRVQRQVISLLRRMISEIPPQRALMVINFGVDLNARITLLDYLVAYLAKAITAQIKVKGSGALTSGSVMMGSSVTPAPPATWFMRGQTTNKHAHLVAKLILDMAEDRISSAWGEETRLALATYASQVAQITDAERRPDRCIKLPTIWMALAALCVCDQSFLDLLNSSTANETRDEAEVRSYCVNHDDGSTMGVVDCRSCGPLCAECDRFLHLNRSARMHHRQICKEEESAIRIDIHEGCGRAKLFWLLLLVDRRTLKGLAEFRSLESVCEGQNFLAGEGSSTGFHGLAGTCRFCGARSTSGLLAIGNVCAEEQCQEFSREACTRVLPCGHVCGGVRAESHCLPCLMGCNPPEDSLPLRQDADDMCMICFTDPLQAAPAIQLTCGHVFHLHCCKKVLICKWIGPRITFSFSQCPICKEDMTHWTLEELLAPIRLLREEVRRKALMRLEYEGLAEAQGPAAADAATFAMERYAYYVCHKCGKAYFGGLARCEAEFSGRWEPTELVCGGCSDVAGARVCPKHSSDFLEYKCRYCCSVAVFFCFGTSHFCNACHDDFQRVTNIPRHQLPQCPAGPKGEQLPGSSEECPLHVQHPPTGEEFALGCGVCRHSQAF